MMKNEMMYYYIQITIDGGHEIDGPPFKFNYYKDPKIYSLTPDSGPISGGTLVNLIAAGLN